MKEISIILPVYNSKQYIEKCLNSITCQLNDVCELIIVNDGSTDKTIDIIKKYQQNYNNIVIYNIEHDGISNARNYGIDKVKSKYFIFVDSDDYIACDLIEQLSNYTNNQYDLIRYQADMVNDENIEKKFNTAFYGEYNGLIFLKNLCTNDEIFGPPWFYCYNTNFIKKNKFRYANGKIQEDFGLTPLIISRASKILSIDYTGYYYYKSNNSIMRNNDYDSTLKKFFDILFHYDFLTSEFKKMNIKEKSIYMYLKKVVYSKYKKLKDIDQLKYKKLLKQRGINCDKYK